jgi:hypothetical protein
MFEPWPAPVTMEDEDDLEKSRVGLVFSLFYNPPKPADL